MPNAHTQALDMYMRRMHRVIMILAPFFCLMAGILFTSYKLLGFYPNVETTPLAIFDATCVLYCVIGAALCIGCIDENDRLKASYFRAGKVFVLVSLVIQWNFISYLFPVAEFWLFMPFFLIAGLVYLDTKFTTTYAILLLVSIAISWIVRPEVFLPASSAYFVPDLVLRIFCLCVVALAMCIVTFIVRRICVTDVTNQLVHEAERLSYVDQLTKLNNRKAYDLACDSVLVPERLGVLFADVNGLKYTNDKEGHAAGDARIVAFAGMLTECFREKEVFRISGDEFVVLCENIDKELFDQRVAKLQELVNANGEPLATVGTAYGFSSPNAAVIEAERHMYRRKVQIHEQYPHWKRAE